MLVRAEIEFLGGWEAITIEQALEVSRKRIIRCPVCHQRVSVHKARVDGKSRAHFEHWPHSRECAPLSGEAAAETRQAF